MNLGVISIYPPPTKKHAKLGGVGSYTKNLVESLQKKVDHIYIFSNKNQSPHHIHTQENITVDYCWDEGTVKFPFQIFFQVLKKRKIIDALHIQYEVFLYGGFFYALFVPIMIALLRLLRIPMMITIHQIVPYSQVNKRFLQILGVNGSPFLFKNGLVVLLKFINTFSDGLIVHEHPFKQSLIKEYGCKEHQKIHVIHHGVESSAHQIKQSKARLKLGIPEQPVLLFFGYLSHYKGIDLLIDAMKLLKHQEFYLIVAGGRHPRLKNDPSYKSFLSGLKEKVKDGFQNVRFTGFVSEEDIGYYFSAADLIVFPYIIVMSSSGPMALAFSYEKPFLASQSYQGMVDENLLFQKTPQHLSQKIDLYLKDSHLQNDIQKFVVKTKQQRTWDETGRQHLTVYQHMREKK